MLDLCLDFFLFSMHCTQCRQPARHNFFFQRGGVNKATVCSFILFFVHILSLKFVTFRILSLRFGFVLASQLIRFPSQVHLLY
jgi:hypothetical protein